MTLRFGLILAVVVLATANIVYFATRDNSDSSDEIEAKWVAYMPDLEASQREHPENLLRSSHINDSRYPQMYEVREEKTLPVFSRIAGECRVEAYSIRSMTDYPGQMPDRLFLSELSADQRSCVAGKLPAGYALAELTEPTKPSRIGWTDDLSKRTVSLDANAQTY